MGLTPWEKPGVPEQVRGLAEGPGALPPGACLDLGCGSGIIAVHLAQLGWRVVGVDMVPKALSIAAGRSAGVTPQPRWVLGDVADLAGLGVEPGADLILDIGCLFITSRESQRRAAHAITALTSPGALLLRFGVLTRELAERDLLPGWRMLWYREQRRPRWPFTKAVPTWCCLERVHPDDAASA